MDLHIAAAVYAIIFVAELPDKTALAALVLATRHKPFPVFVGASLALTIQSLIAVAAGQLLTVLPSRPIHVVAGLLFIGSAAIMWRRGVGGEAPARSGTESRFVPVLTKAFGVVFIAEWGDLTQVGTAALAAHYAAPVPVFAGATLALWSVLALAVLLGNRAARTLPPERTKQIAAVVFAGVGVALLLGWL
jgi:putative Ca2+/H+ antiporter (TMEM165/GDT1 family)